MEVVSRWQQQSLQITVLGYQPNEHLMLMLTNPKKKQSTEVIH